MALFLVQIALGDGFTFKNGVDSMVVSAGGATAAKEIAKSHFTGDAGDAAWDAATATVLADVTVDDALAMVGWVFNIVVQDPTTLAIVSDSTVIGDATDDTLDEIGTALAVELNTADLIANAAYTAATQTLIVATGAGDVLGDHIVTVTVKPPAVVNASGDLVNDPQNIASFVVSNTDQGIGSADLTIVFAADTFVVPTVLGALSST